MNNKKLFIGSLAWAVNDEILTEAFSQAGTVESAHVMTDKFTGRSRGFAFVEMSSEEEAQKAIEMFDGQEIEGRPVAVNIAKPREERAPREDSYSRY